MRCYRKILTALVVVVFSAQAPSAFASETGCRVYGSLSSVVLDTRNFLDHLGNGENAQSARILEKRLKKTSTSSLPQQLKQLELKSFAEATGILIAQQQSLLRTYMNTSRGSAAQNAKALGARSQLNEVYSLLGTVPCTSSSSTSFAGFGVASKVEALAKSSAFWLVASMFLLGGVAVGLFGWFSQIGKRRTKRYSCLMPCTVIVDDVIHPAMITNISRTGAKLNTDEGFDRGQRVLVSFMGESAECSVIRHKNGKLAVNFNAMLHLEVLEKVLNGLTAASIRSASMSPSSGR
jgi:hypothetical protein